MDLSPCSVSFSWLLARTHHRQCLSSHQHVLQVQVTSMPPAMHSLVATESSYVLGLRLLHKCVWDRRKWQKGVTAQQWEGKRRMPQKCRSRDRGPWGCCAACLSPRRSVSKRSEIMTCLTDWNTRSVPPPDTFDLLQWPPDAHLCDTECHCTSGGYPMPLRTNTQFTAAMFNWLVVLTSCWVSPGAT